MNKFQQISSTGHQISLARLRGQEGGARPGPGGSPYNMRPHVQKGPLYCEVHMQSGGHGQAGLYVEVQCIMDNGHIGTPLLTE